MNKIERLKKELARRPVKMVTIRMNPETNEMLREISYAVDASQNRTVIKLIEDEHKNLMRSKKGK